MWITMKSTILEFPRKTGLLTGPEARFNTFIQLFQNLFQT